MKHLTLIQKDDPLLFKKVVEKMLNEKHVLSVKFQRNLYYSLSGSSHVEGKLCLEEGKELKQSHLAFVVWEDRLLARLANFFKKKKEVKRRP